MTQVYTAVILRPKTGGLGTFSCNSEMSHRENEGELWRKKFRKKCSLSTGMTRQPSMLSQGL